MANTANFYKPSILPGEWEMQQSDLERKRRIAELLQQQSLQSPEGQMVSGHYVAPSITQYLAQALKGYSAQSQLNNIDKQQHDAYAKRQNTYTEANQSLANALKGTPVTQPVDYADAGGMPGAEQTTQQPPSQDQIFGALGDYYSKIGDPSAMGNLAMERVKFGQQNQAREDQQQFNRETLTLQQQAAAQARQDAREARAQELQLKLQDAATSRAEQLAARKELMQMQIDARKDISAIASAGGGKPFYQFIGTPQGIVTGDARTGKLSLGTIAGSPVMKSADSPELQGNIAGAKAQGKSQGEASGALADAQSSMPQLENTIGQLKALSNTMTYTKVGQGMNAVRTQLGMDPRKGAVDREKYVNTVRDVLFPQLRQTFGAQFTVKEGEALIQTLGDPNKTPQERNATLDAFIDQKRQHLQSLQRRVRGANPAFDPADIGMPPPGAVRRKN